MTLYICAGTVVSTTTLPLEIETALHQRYAFSNAPQRAACGQDFLQALMSADALIASPGDRIDRDLIFCFAGLVAPHRQLFSGARPR